jgi:NADPH2:quinone reductase
VTIADSMIAWWVPTRGEPADVMVLTEIPVPVPGPGQALVEVWSTALSGPDVLLIRGEGCERSPVPFTPGIELCGMVVAVGPGVESSRIGERVIGTPQLPYGALARYTIVAETDLHTAPPGLDDAAASALYIAYQTAWFGLYRRAALRVGETLLVNAAAGDTGSAAVQLGKAAGARVIGVVGGAAQVGPVRTLGADLVVDRMADDVVEAVRAFTAGRGADVVYDPAGDGADVTAPGAVAFEGRIVVVALPGRPITEDLLVDALAGNRTVVGLRWGSYRDRDPGLIRRAHNDLGNLVEAGGVRPLLGERLTFEDARGGLERLAGGCVVGRFTVLPPS